MPDMRILLSLLQHFNIRNYRYFVCNWTTNNCRCKTISLLVLIGGTAKKVDLL